MFVMHELGRYHGSREGLVRHQQVVIERDNQLTLSTAEQAGDKVGRQLQLRKAKLTLPCQSSTNTWRVYNVKARSMHEFGDARQQRISSIMAPSSS